MNKFTKLPSSLGNLSALNLLNLGQNNIGGSIPLSLGNCQQLSALVLSHNNLYDSIPLQVLNLSSISISFDLGYNSLTGSLPSEVGSLKNLTKFDVSNNRLSGSILNLLSGCSSLEELHLEGNSFEGEIPQGLRELRGLRELDLSHNNLMGLIPSYIGELPLEKLNLSFNLLRGEVPIQGVFRNASAISIVGIDDLCGGVADLNLPPCPSSTSKRNKLSYRTKIILYVVVALVICSTLAVSLFMFCRRRRVSRKESSSKPSFEHQILRVSYVELLKATNGFSKANLLGIGNYASVYKGILDQDQIVVVVKPSNVLLDDTMVAHVGDFGLAKIISAASIGVWQHQSNSSAIRGTIGYVPPEYGMGDMASTLGDVYSFGILLLETFTGKRPTDNMFKDHLSLHTFVKTALPHRVMDIIDPCIQQEHESGSWVNNCMVSILTIGVACSLESPRDRMEMGTVVSKLCKIKKTCVNEGLKD
ncbi:hypothetical protein RHMOL_Rhmol11G0115200 [Rhododendron molle]|uniref:Uncharacterized protein n=1 Tax=Rhododendron molle TaxID=49168 RepID=A0ACC0LRZ2_RHOML|nr:hypothetical protein RHMOL_Rhmol11G0115200 [Rhododendron molle]